MHPAARKLLAALAQHAPARFTWGQAATLAGLKAAGGHCNAGRKQLRDLGLIEEAADLVASSRAGLDAAGEAPDALEEQLALVWRNIRTILGAAGMGVEHVVRVTTYLRDAADAEASGAARVAALGGRVVPTTAIEVRTLDASWLVEVEVIAAA